MKPLNLNLHKIPPKPLSHQSTRPKPLYLLHQMAFKHKPSTSKSSHQITPLIDDPRSMPMPQRRAKEASFSFSALDHRMQLLTKGVYSTRKSLIRSPKQMLSSLKTGNFNARMTITTSERKKRDLLTLTGGLTSANLKSLMGFKEEKETKFYALSIRDSQFKNYKYKKPNVLCEHIFFKETIRKPTGPPKARPSTTQQLENCIENLRSTKKRENERENFNEYTENHQEKQNSGNGYRERSRSFKDAFEETMEDILDFLDSEPDFSSEPRNNNIVLEVPQINSDKKDVFLRCGNCKHPWMLKEFSYLWDLSKKAFKLLEKIKKPHPAIESIVLSRKALLLAVVKHNFSGFKGRNRLINDRVLLALGLNSLKPLSLIPMEKYFRLVRLAFLGDQSQEELIEFAVSYFRVSSDGYLEKEEFFRLLKTLTEQIDQVIEDGKSRRRTLFENFLENFYMTGILKKDEKDVDFKKFKEVYGNYQMNIYDLVDLIFGRI